MAGNEERITLGDEEFNKLIGGEELVIETDSGTTVHIILQDIGWGRMQYLIEQWLHNRQQPSHWGSGS